MKWASLASVQLFLSSLSSELLILQCEKIGEDSQYWRTFPSFLASRDVLVGIIVLMGQKVLVFITSGMLIQSVLSVVCSVILCSPYPFELYKNIG